MQVVIIVDNFQQSRDRQQLNFDFFAYPASLKNIRTHTFLTKGKQKWYFPDTE